MRTRLPQYYVQCTRVNKQHFGGKIIILVQVLAKIPQIQKQVIKCQKFLLSFCDQERSLPPSTSITVLTFLVKQKGKLVAGVYILRIHEKNLSQILSHKLPLSLNLKVSFRVQRHNPYCICLRNNTLKSCYSIFAGIHFQFTQRGKVASHLIKKVPIQGLNRNTCTKACFNYLKLHHNMQNFICKLFKGILNLI